MKSRPLRRKRGFALIVTLSLMILLTVIAVGLLSISSISLRASTQGDAMQTARANARLALMLAIGDLQKQLGPDTRVSATADQLAGSDPSSSSSPVSQKNWAGAYKSWPAALPADSRPAPEFLQWFVSGDPAKTNTKAFASTSVSGASVEIVTTNAVGKGDPVKVPMLSQSLTGGMKNNFAWWVSDLGTKALVAKGKALPTAIAEVRADQQSMPASNLRNAGTGATKPFSALAVTDAKLDKVISWQSAGIVADAPANTRELFHDLTTQSRGLITNVRAGGFRKDLSMELERSSASAPTPSNSKNVLYTVGNATDGTGTGINLQELWAYYNLSNPSNNPRGVKWSGGGTFTTGGSFSSGTPYLQVESSPQQCQNDDGFYFKQPVVISYQLVLSFESRPAKNAAGATVNRLYLVADPIITLWNPLDMPVVIPTTSFLTVKYWQIPYDFEISINGANKKNYSFAGIWRTQAEIDDSKNGSAKNGDGNVASLQMGQLQQLVFKPGEVIKMSQTGASVVKGTSPVDHALVGKAGFNYGGGVSLPIRDLDGNYVDMGPSDVVTYVCKPNKLTAGKTTSSGNSVLNTATNHSRHFSLTHHEYYIGKDRSARSDGGDDGTSLGIGTMAIDWDFGNRRLKTGEDRGATSPGVAGTKPSTSRLYADTSKLAGIFKTFTDGRPLPVSGLSSKQPFLLVSYNAKTEQSSKLGTRTLSRFNPKALHVDFYDLEPLERDMLPYEFSVESLQGWKSADSLETSSSGNAYFGGGMNATTGTSFVTTHSIPREPIVSLAALQHSFANGFIFQKPRFGYGTLNAREPLLPQISHAIGNSMACPVLSKTDVTGATKDGRPLADHSYLANQALWDDWFFSGIAPQTTNTFGKSRTQKTVASDFFNDTLGDKAKLPVSRYSPELNGLTADKIVSTYFTGAAPSNLATTDIASFITVKGMFNINSTSVEAWKSLLGARQERPYVVRTASGGESVKNDGKDTPVAGLLSPMDSISKGSGSVDPQDSSQWNGRRTLSDTEIDKLAREIVKEIRKRGPFLSLADFVNRRVGSDESLARSGAIQSALDSADSGINAPYSSGSRAVSGGSSLPFSQAEQGSKSYGAPGIIKQADILTPIAPILSARSDSFLIRGYGEKTDASGRVIARAWCEAVVQRSTQFVDPADLPGKLYSSISTQNKLFGRRFDIVSFRWLSPSEA